MDVACDACCIINFLAAGNILPTPTEASVRAAIDDRQLFVPTQVASESLYLLQPDPGEPDKLLKTKIDLETYFKAGVLQRCHVETDENSLFVQLAAEVDDGEAACLAIAKFRGMTLASDDRPASRLAAELGIPIFNTAQFLHYWAERSGATRVEIAAAIQRIQRYARFSPREGSAQADWWLAHAS